MMRVLLLWVINQRTIRILHIYISLQEKERYELRAYSSEACAIKNNTKPNDNRANQRWLWPHSRENNHPQRYQSQRVQSTHTLECRDSIFGITTMIWESIHPPGTLNP